MQRANVRELGAAGGADNILAVLVLHDDLIGVMAVTVKPCVNAADVRNHIAVHPRGALCLVAYVPHDDYVISTFGAGGVNGFLHGVVNAFAGLILQKSIDVVAAVVHEVTRSRRAEGIRCGHADEGDLHAADLFHEPRLKDQLALFVEVAADVRELGLFGKLQEAVHAIIKLVVAGDGHIIAHDVHDIDNGLAFGHGADGLALNSVAVIDEEHVVILGEVFLYGIEACITPALVDAAVDVAGKEDENILILSLRKGAGAVKADEQRREETNRQNKRQCFFHGDSS